MARTCGGCALCCDLIPVKELGTKAFCGCPHRRDLFHTSGPGCGIYDRRPPSCRLWRCMWLGSPPENMADELRPDRVGFVVDENVDLVKVGGVDTVVGQVWVSPGHEQDYEQDGAAPAVIRALCDEYGAVLWRLPPGDRARLFRKGANGNVELSPIIMTPDSHETSLGPAGVRLARAAQILARRK
jgi:hypothetical protein